MLGLSGFCLCSSIDLVPSHLLRAVVRYKRIDLPFIKATQIQCHARSEAVYNLKGLRICRSRCSGHKNGFIVPFEQFAVCASHSILFRC